MMESRSTDSRNMTKDIVNIWSNCCELEAQVSLHWRLLTFETVKIKTTRSSKATPVSPSLQALCRHWLWTIESHWSFQDLHVEAWYKRTRFWNPTTCPDGSSTMTPKSPTFTWRPPAVELAWEQVCQTTSLISPSRNSSLTGVLDFSNKVTKNRSTSLVEAQFTLSNSGLPVHSKIIAWLWIEDVLDFINQRKQECNNSKGNNQKIPNMKTIRKRTSTTSLFDIGCNASFVVVCSASLVEKANPRSHIDSWEVQSSWMVYSSPSPSEWGRQRCRTDPRRISHLEFYTPQAQVFRAIVRGLQQRLQQEHVEKTPPPQVHPWQSCKVRVKETSSLNFLSLYISC